MESSVCSINGIELKNVSLNYDKKIIFQSVNLHVSRGRTACLLGATGVGKTCLLRLVAGLIDKNKVNHQCNISYMEQTSSLLPWLSVIENVLIGYTLRGIRINKELQEKASFLLQKVGLIQVKKEFPKILSGGMKQRVALVRTLLEDCPVVLMDEPFSAIDSITRVQLQTLTASLFIDKAVLWVTHDPFEAARMGHDVYIMGGDPITLHKIPLSEDAYPRSLDIAGKYVGDLFHHLQSLGRN